MATGIQTVKDLLELVSYCAVILGVPAALAQYFYAKRREQLDREYGTYDELDDKYIEYQRLCIEHPRLDVWDTPDKNPHSLTAEEAKQELQLFTVLFAIFERAYLMYSDTSTKQKTAQWRGWEDYIKSFCSRGNFRKAWSQGGSTFDEQFHKYMQGCIK